MTDVLQAAAELARLTGSVALRHYRTGFAVDRKADGSPVTPADRAAEAFARAWIAERFPRDGVLGEEFGSHPGGSGRHWVIDPIDGTASFIRGVPLWGSLVAIVEGETVLAGAASFPAVGEHLAAAPGQGCFLDGARCRVSAVARIADATVLTTNPQAVAATARAAGWERLQREAARTRTWGDCFGYLMVASGRAEVMIDARLHPWDGACFVPIVAEAGGVLTDFDGAASPAPAHAVATNAALAHAVRGVLGIGRA